MVKVCSRKALPLRLPLYNSNDSMLDFIEIVAKNRNVYLIFC